MTRESELATLNKISQALNQAVDVGSAMQFALENLLEAMGLETGWIFLKDEANQDRWEGRGYSLVAVNNLPPGMSLDEKEPWDGGCDCQGFCNTGKLTEAYNEVRCTRLRDAIGDRRGLEVHASAPLKSGENVLGILNVAARDWGSFSDESLELLTNIGSQMGVALERARLYDLLKERRISEQQVLLEISAQLLRRLTVEDLAHYFEEEIPRALDLDACALWISGEREAEGTLVGKVGWQIETGTSPDPISELAAWVGEALQGQATIHIESLSEQEDLPEGWAALKGLGVEGLVLLPLVAEERLMGAMVLGRARPWVLDSQEERFYRLLANQLALAIEKTRLIRQEVAQRQIERELALSRQVQAGMLPQFTPRLEGWEFAARYMPAHEVGGDFYDYFELPQAGDGGQEWGLVVADVADKGMPAAIFMALSRAMIRSAAFSLPSPAEALRQANQTILQEASGSLFLTAFYARLHPETGRLRFTNAGHNRPLWVTADGKSAELATGGMVLGVFEEVHLEEAEVQLSPGDSIVLYTDGIIEAMNRDEELFGRERLAGVVEAAAGSPPQRMLEQVVDAVEQFAAGAEQADDITVLVARRLPR